MSHQYFPKNWDVLLVVLAPKVRKQSVSNTRVDPGGKYGRISCPKRVLSWVVAHLPSRTMHEVPKFYTYRNLLLVGGVSSIVDRPFCFPTCFAVVVRQKIGPNGVHSHIQ